MNEPLQRAEAAVASQINNSPSEWIELMARVGFAAKGLVYTIIGFMALSAAFSSGGGVEDSGGALRTLVDEPFGKVLLVVVGLGLIGYAVWRFIQAIKDPENEGTDGKGLVKRIGYGISGFVHASLALQAFNLTRGRQGEGGDANAQDWTATLMAQPFGRFLVILVGVIILGWAVREFMAAYRAKFMRKIERPGVDANTLKIIRNVGRLGYGARGVVMIIVGGFIALAGVRYDASQARGISGALESLGGQPFGQFLLALAGFGLLCYGAFQFVNARYRFIRTE